MKSDTSLLAQQLYVHMYYADSLQTSAKDHLEVIPSADDALRNLGTFVFLN